MKRPFDTIRDVTFDSLERVRENQKYNFLNSERFMIWIVGFSIGGLGIIVTNITSIHDFFSYSIIKIVLALFTTSIVSGIIYRWAFYNYQVQYQHIEFFLHEAFSNKESMEIEPDDLEDEEDIKEVVRRIKNDFGEDFSYLLQVYTQVDEKNQQIMLSDLKSHYKRTGEWARKDYLNAIDYLKDTLQQAFDLSDNGLEKLFKNNSAKKLKVFGWIASSMFVLSSVSFVTVLILLTVLY